MNITRKDKEEVVNIISSSIDKIPSLDWLVKNDSIRPKRFLALADYIFEFAFIRKGIFLSNDRKGIVIMYKYNARRQTLYDRWIQFKLILNAISIERFGEMLKRDNYIKKQRPADGNYLHVLFFGVHPSARGTGAGMELKRFLFAESQRQQLPIYIETTLDQNKTVYERFGFKIYHKWFVEHRGINFYFLKREPDKLPPVTAG